VALGRMHGVRLLELTAPEHDFAACAHELGVLAGEHDVVMPLDDLAVLLCDRALPSDATVAGPRGSQARLALDKREQLRAAEAAGLAVPAWTQADREMDLGGEWEPPVMLKPALAAEQVDGRLRRLSPRLVGSRVELEELLSSWGAATPAIVQRWIGGGVGGGVFGVAEHGAAHHLSAHRRVRMMNPAGSGSSACMSVPVPEALRGPVSELLRAAAWNGMFMVELLHADGRWWFMELNGRAWGSLALARRLGYEYPAWAVARLLDEHAALPEEPAFAQLQCRHLGRELVHLLYVLRGPRSHAEAWPSRRQTLRALLADGGPTSWYNLAPGMRAVFLEDTWRTVFDQTLGKRLHHW